MSSMTSHCRSDGLQHWESFRAATAELVVLALDPPVIGLHPGVCA